MRERLPRHALDAVGFWMVPSLTKPRHKARAVMATQPLPVATSRARTTSKEGL